MQCGHRAAQPAIDAETVEMVRYSRRWRFDHQFSRIAARDGTLTQLGRAVANQNQARKVTP